MPFSLKKYKWMKWCWKIITPMMQFHSTSFFVCVNLEVSLDLQLLDIAYRLYSSGSTLTLLLIYSAAEPHTVVDGKQVVNFASANYLGLIGNKKIIVRYKPIISNYSTTFIFLDIQTKYVDFRIHASVHWRNTVLGLVAHVAFMEQ
jgi:hypothetical protein